MKNVVMTFLHKSQFLTAAVSDSRVDHLKLQRATSFEALVYLKIMVLGHRRSKKPSGPKPRTLNTTNLPINVEPSHMYGNRLNLGVQTVNQFWNFVAERMPVATCGGLFKITYCGTKALK